MAVGGSERMTRDQRIEIVRAGLRVEAPRELDRAEDLRRKRAPQAGELVLEKAVVEARIVSDEDSALDLSGNVVGYLAEGRRRGHHGVADTGERLDRRWNAAFRVDQAAPLADLRSFVDAHDPDLGHAIGAGGHAGRFEIDEGESDSIRFRSGGVLETAKFFRDGTRLYILHRGTTFAIHDLTLAAPKTAATNGGDGKVRAAMNGRVVAVLVKQGERVAAGQPVMTLEAMKMEHVHTAGIAGVISAIDVAEGEQVTTGKIVVEIEAEAT